MRRAGQAGDFRYLRLTQGKTFQAVRGTRVLPRDNGRKWCARLSGPAHDAGPLCAQGRAADHRCLRANLSSKPVEALGNGCDQLARIMLDSAGRWMAGADPDFVLGDCIAGFIEYQRTSRMATLIEDQCPLPVVGVASHCLDRRLPGILR